MASYQKILIVGNLGQDPELRYLPNGDAVANFSVGVSERWKDANGAPVERTEWFRCSAFRRQAEIAGEYLKKGAQVLVEGKQQTRKYTAQDGTEKYSVELRVDSFTMLGSRADGEQQRSPSTGAPRQQRTSNARQSTPNQPTRGGGFDDMDPDIPF
ncbi:single-stranded DNA-binding protein [Caballeronia novacaledonica]|uniref:Single-stranded DNA-binding protein n=1 Tax=Caballeronia novacaledonica TaxID=1544861 RepID=A0ACB5R5A7_9BURK|nr:single-stranded DNA-binding protein [Caballeronia novacaledonica]